MLWWPMPVNARNEVRVKGMILPRFLPLNYDKLKDFQQSWFWNLVLALAEAGGYLPVGSDLWRIVGAHSRSRWDANCDALLAAFDYISDDAHGRRIFYAPLLKILEQQKRKLAKFSTFPQGGDHSSLYLFSSDVLNGRKPVKGFQACPIHGEAGLTPWGTCGACYGEKYAKSGGCEPA